MDIYKEIERRTPGLKYWIFKHSWSTTEKLFRGIQSDNRVDYYGNVSFVPKFLSFWYLYTKHLKKKKFVPTSIIKLPKNGSENFCFVFFGGVNISVGLSIMKKIKKRFPRSRSVAYFTDIIDLNRFNVATLKKFYDEIFVFDQKTAFSLNVNYCPLPFDFPKHHDIVYIGQLKGRIQKLQEISNYLAANNVKSFFYLADSKVNTSKYSNGVIIGPPMQYEIMLMHLVSSNCILELKNDLTDAYTDRIQKAVVLNKKILTNNLTVLDDKYYNPDLIKYFNNYDDIDLDFIKSNINSVTYGYQGDYNPSYLLDLLDNNFDNI